MDFKVGDIVSHPYIQYRQRGKIIYINPDKMFKIWVLWDTGEDVFVYFDLEELLKG